MLCAEFIVDGLHVSTHTDVRTYRDPVRMWMDPCSVVRNTSPSSFVFLPLATVAFDPSISGDPHGMNMSMAVRTWPKDTTGVAGLRDVQQPPRETTWAFPWIEQERGEHVERRNPRLRLG